LSDLHSPKGLLATPVQFLINAIIESTNHMAVASMHLGVWSCQDNLLNSKLNVRMGKKGDLSNFERGCWCQMGQSEYFTICSVTGIFTHKPFQGFTKNGVKREKHPVCSSSVGENALLMLEVRGEWAD